MPLFWIKPLKTPILTPPQGGPPEMTTFRPLTPAKKGLHRPCTGSTTRFLHRIDYITPNLTLIPAQRGLHSPCTEPTTRFLHRIDYRPPLIGGPPKSTLFSGWNRVFRPPFDQKWPFFDPFLNHSRWRGVDNSGPRRYAGPPNWKLGFFGDFGIPFLTPFYQKSPDFAGPPRFYTPFVVCPPFDPFLTPQKSLFPRIESCFRLKNGAKTGGGSYPFRIWPFSTLFRPF